MRMSSLYIFTSNRSYRSYYIVHLMCISMSILSLSIFSHIFPLLEFALLGPTYSYPMPIFLFGYHQFGKFFNLHQFLNFFSRSISFQQYFATHSFLFLEVWSHSKSCTIHVISWAFIFPTYLLYFSYVFNASEIFKYSTNRSQTPPSFK